MDNKIVFMGSPSFATPILNALIEKFGIVGIVTQPDSPVGRGRILKSPPIKLIADEKNIEVLQPRRLKDPENYDQLRKWDPDVIIVAAYGQILRQNILELPPCGSINVHASLLPHWRGAAPIQASILNGDKTTGVSIMKMDEGIDTGPIYAQREIEILPAETAGELTERLATLGAQLLIDTLPSIIIGKIEAKPQNDALASYAPLLKKEDGKLNLSDYAANLTHKVRAFNPWPGAFIKWKEQNLKIHKAYSVDSEESFPGVRRVIKGFPAIGTQRGWLILEEVQPAGKKKMLGSIFLNGVRDWIDIP